MESSSAARRPVGRLRARVQVASSSRVARSPQAMRARAGSSSAVTSDSPMASAIPAGRTTALESRPAARAGLVAPAAATACAAQRQPGLSSPPGPVSVISRSDGRDSHRCSVRTSSSRPIRSVGASGSRQFRRPCRSLPPVRLEQRVARFAVEVERASQRTYRVEMGAPSLSSLQGADGMNGEPGNRGQFFLREPCGFAEPFQSRAKRSATRVFKTRDLTSAAAGAVRVLTGAVGGRAALPPARWADSEDGRPRLGADDCFGGSMTEQARRAVIVPAHGRVSMKSCYPSRCCATAGALADAQRG